MLVQEPLPPPHSLRQRRSCCSRRSPRVAASAVAVLVLLCFHWERPAPSADVTAADTRFAYEGRWLRGKSTAAADWPCSSVRFAVGTGGDADATPAVTVVWSGVRVRLNATVVDAKGAVLAAHTLRSPAWDYPFAGPHSDELRLPAGAAEVRLRKLSCAAPFQLGIGGLLTSSKLTLHGVVLTGGAALGPAPLPPSRQLEFIGASDTAGFCVDGLDTDSALRTSALPPARAPQPLRTRRTRRTPPPEP